MARILTSADFDNTIATGVTFVDFFADWCGPCQALLPVIDELAETYTGRAAVCKIDVDASGDIAERYGVMSIPTILVFRDGELVEKVIGVQPITSLAAMIDKHL